MKRDWGSQDDSLPPPAYQGQPAAPLQLGEDTAVRVSAAGVPTDEAMARLRAAVKNHPRLGATSKSG